MSSPQFPAPPLNPTKQTTNLSKINGPGLQAINSQKRTIEVIPQRANAMQENSRKIVQTARPAPLRPRQNVTKSVAKARKSHQVTTSQPQPHQQHRRHFRQKGPHPPPFSTKTRIKLGSTLAPLTPLAPRTPLVSPNPQQHLQRLARRLRHLVEQMANGVGRSIPFACQDWAAYLFFPTTGSVKSKSWPAILLPRGNRFPARRTCL